MGKYKGILFISNDMALMTQKLTTGWGDQALRGKLWKSIKKNSMYGYWDIPRTMQMANDNGLPVDEQLVNMSKESLRNVQFWAARNQSDNYETSFSFDFVNHQTNSLELLLNFINKTMAQASNQSSL